MINKIKAFLFENKGMRHTVIKNTAWLFFGEAVGRILKLALVVYAARTLGTTNWGVFSYALSLAGIFSLFSDFGISSLLTREISKNGPEKAKYLSTIFSVKIILVFISSFLLMTVAPYISKIPEATNLLFIIMLLLIFDSLREFALGLNRAYEKMQVEAFIKILINVSVSIVGLYFVFNMPSVKNILIIYVSGSGLGCIMLFYILRRNFKNIFSNFSKKLIKPIFDFAWPFAILTFFGTIMTNTDMLMLGWLATPNDIGLYSVAQKFTQFLYIIPGLLSVALFPSFSKLVENNDQRFDLILVKIIRFLLLFGFPLVIGGTLLSKSILILVFGSQYAAAATTLSVTLFMILINFPTIIVDNAILAHNQQKRFLKYTLIAVVLNVILNYILIPIYGSTGAATATLISSSLGMGMIIFKFRKLNNFKTPFRLGKIILSTIIMSISILILKTTEIKLIPTIAISIVIYMLTIYLLKDQTIREVASAKA